MKNRKLKFILIGVIGISFFCGIAGFKISHENVAPGYITMRLYENFTVTSSKIIIVYADSTHETINLAPFKYNDEYLIHNNKIVTKTLNRLRDQGYRLITSASNGKVTSNRDMLITTFILEKN